MRERAVEQFEAGELDLTERNHAAGINAGLKAQALIDKREQSKKKSTQSEALVALLAALRGEGFVEPPKQLNDPNVIEGVAVEIED